MSFKVRSLAGAQSLFLVFGLLCCLLVGCEGDDSTRTELTNDGCFQVIRPSSRWQRSKKIIANASDARNLLLHNKRLDQILEIETQKKYKFGYATAKGYMRAQTLGMKTKGFVAASSPKSYELNGYPAVERMFEGRVKGSDAKMLVTVVETEEDYQILIAGGDKNNFDAAKDDLEKLVASFTKAGKKEPRTLDRGAKGKIKSKDKSFEIVKLQNWAPNFSTAQMGVEEKAVFDEANLSVGSFPNREFCLVHKTERSILGSTKISVATIAQSIKESAPDCEIVGKMEEIKGDIVKGHWQSATGTEQGVPISWVFAAVQSKKYLYIFTFTTPQEQLKARTPKFLEVIKSVKEYKVKAKKNEGQGGATMPR